MLKGSQKACCSLSDGQDGRSTSIASGLQMEEVMLLAIDVGNTNITCGVFDGTVMITRFHFTVRVSRTSDEYGNLFCDILERKGVTADDINQVIIASVVPKIMYSLNSGIIKYLDCQPIIVGAGIRTGIRIETANPKEVGPDRIVDAVAAHTLYGGPVIIADYGTATTYDFVTEDGIFLGGVISPGVRISANALWNETANLPEIEIKCPEHVVAKDTITAMQAGLFLGTVGQSEYIIHKIKEETGLWDIKVVATGGLGKMIADYAEEIDIYDSDLTLKGLQIIYNKQNRE